MMHFVPLGRKYCLRFNRFINRTVLLLVCLGVGFSVTNLAHAQTNTISVDGGGSLSFMTNTNQEYCFGAHGLELTYQTTSYSLSAYTDVNGVTTQFSHPILGNATLSPSITGCPKTTNFNRTFTPSSYVTVNFTGDGGGSAYATAITQSVIDPAYKVVSILYATPGNFSSDQFTNTTTTGSTTTIAQSFTQGTSVSFDLGFLGLAQSGLSFGASTTTGSSNAFQETIANASMISNASNSSGPNTVSHSQDLILIWLNPEVSLIQTGSTNVSYSLGTPSINGSAEPVDVIAVTASAMEDNASHQTSVPLGALQIQPNGLPGLASICSQLNITEYQSNSCTQADQCGCFPSDFAPILSKDPFLNIYPVADADTSFNPINIDVSGTLCTAATSSNDCRYVPVPYAAGSSYQQVKTLQGPTSQGGNRTVNSYTQTDATSSTSTLSGSTTETVSYTTKAGFPLLGTVSNTRTWSWTNSQSQGAINGTTNQIGFSLSSGTVSCYQDVYVYEDTIFHTFVTQQVPGNYTCP